MKNDILKDQMGIDSFIEMPVNEFVVKYSEIEAIYNDIDKIKEKIAKEEKKLKKEMKKLTFKTFINDANNVGADFLIQLGKDRIMDFFDDRIILLEQDKLKIEKDRIDFIGYSDKFSILKFDEGKWNIDNLVYVINPEHIDARNMYDICYQNCKDTEKAEMLKTIQSVFPNYIEQEER